MKEIRCKKCNYLLYRLEAGGEVKLQEIKCKKCKYLNRIAEVKYNPDYETRSSNNILYNSTTGEIIF